MYQLILMMSLFPAQPDALAQFRPCVWPNVCVQQVETVVEEPISTCDYPNKCS